MWETKFYRDRNNKILNYFGYTEEPWPHQVPVLTILFTPWKTRFFVIAWSELNNKVQTKLSSIGLKPKTCEDIYLSSWSGGRILNTNQLFNPDQCNETIILTVLHSWRLIHFLFDNGNMQKSALLTGEKCLFCLIKIVLRYYGYFYVQNTFGWHFIYLEYFLSINFAVSVLFG